ncbi:VCBS repeat-containing protein [Flavobacteriaceae bacterium]|nr:VCBS repeat-containing protein [Flavobacteriaceae bacterium]
MKKLLYPFAFALTAFLVLYSCSAVEEDTTPPPSIIQTPEPEPEPEVSQYTLTVTAGEGGTVSTEGGTYDEGTEVTITATPAEGYEFVGWEGNDSTEASLTVTLGANTTLNAIFLNLDYFELQQNFIVIPNGTNLYMDNIGAAINGGSIPGVFIYTIDGETYLYISGTACSEGECEGAYNILDVPANPYLVFKKIDNGWELQEVLDDVKTWAVRNYQFRDNFIVLGGANEEGLSAAQWVDNAFMGELQGNEIQWKKVNSQEDMAFMHDIGVGDFNFDGLMDVITGPGRDLSDPDRCRNVDCNPPGDEYIYNFYFQKNDGTFDLQEAYTVIDYPQDNELHTDVLDDSTNFGNASFALEVIDLDGDGKDEIISSTDWTVVYKYNEVSKKYKMHWYTNHNDDFGIEYVPGDGRGFFGEGIQSVDLNNDSNLDIVLDLTSDAGQHSLIYFGNGDGTFRAGSLKPKIIQPGYQPIFFDINKDSFLDIIYKANDGYFTSDGITINANGDSLAPDYITGIILNNLIWINDGNGGFNQYNDRTLYIPNVDARQIVPYFKDEKLHFIGMREYDRDEQNNLIIDFNNIELNLFE